VRIGAFPNAISSAAARVDARVA